MQRIAVFIDAGYFWVQLCKTITGSYASRGQVTVDYAALRNRLLAEVSSQFPSSDLLRVYWYDGPGNMTGTKTAEHLSIDALDDFKLRLGTRNITGQQKGVDGLMIADLISLTQQRAISAALLVSGDADTAPGVVAAQGMGLRVHLLSLGTTAATSPLLAAEVDMKRSWTLADVAMFASQTAAAVVVTALSPNGVTVQAPASPVDFSAIARTAHTNITSGQLAALVASWPPGTFQIPADIDRALLSDAKSQLGRALHDHEKPLLRNEFRALRA